MMYTVFGQTFVLFMMLSMIYLYAFRTIFKLLLANAGILALITLNPLE